MIDKVIQIREAKIKRLENKMDKDDKRLFEMYKELEYFKDLRNRL